MPFRLWVAKGSTREIVILDESWMAGRDEHNWRDPESGKWNMYEHCVGETESCPLCAKGEKEFGRPRHRSFLTVLDMAWNGRDKRKLMAISDEEVHGAIDDEMASKGTMRGMNLRLTRGADQRSEFGTAEVVGWVSAATLALHFERGHAFDYAALFPSRTAGDLRAQYGGKPPAGSRDEARRALLAASDGMPDWA
jgi:hypothetical protein